MNLEHDEHDYLDSFLESAFRSGDGVHTEAPDQAELDDVPTRIDRYPVVECIGRGGVGVVYRVEDPELGREVAVKVLRPKFRGDPELVARFRGEARVCGRLTHPGIVTIHEIGELDDGAPYFAMRLVEGKTFASMLDPRGDRAPTHELLDVFGGICQTIAYAHDAGVVHGDLKPQNVMVGAFREVQIMDWGFAVEIREHVADGVRSRPRSGGTPAYMAPEQARKSPLDITARTDVFGLGAILCEVLTGTPPYIGELREEVYLSAARGWQDEALARLDACGADARLVELARRCIDPDPENRPDDASVVAREVAAYRAELEDRAKQLEIEAAEAQASATHARRSRRLTVALSAVVLAVIALVGVVAFLVQSAKSDRRLETQRIVDEALAEAAAERSAAMRGGVEEDRHWGAALEAARRAAEFAKARDAAPGLQEQVAEQVARIEHESQAALRAREFVERFAALRPHHGDDRDAAELDAAYAAAFADAGVDLGQPDSEVARTVAESRIADTLVASLDHWSRFRRKHRVESALTWRRLHEIALQSDADPWRGDLRRAFEQRDVEALRELARTAIDGPLDAESYDLLASCLADVGEQETAIDLYRHAVEVHPEDYQLVHNLAAMLGGVDPPPRDEIVRLCWVGLALRPGSAHALTDLGLELLNTERTEQALRFFDRAEAIEPEHPRTSLLRGAALHRLGRIPEAARAYSVAVRGGKPRVYGGYAAILAQLDRIEEAIDASGHAARLAPGDIRHSIQLAKLLGTAGRHEEAIDTLQRAIAGHPDVAELHCLLGGALLSKGRFEAAVEAMQRGHTLGIERGGRVQIPSAGWLANAQRFAEAAADYVRWQRGEIATEDVCELGWFARVALRTDDDDEALRVFDSVLARSDEIDPREYAMICFEAGIALARVVASKPEILGRDADLVARGIGWFESWIRSCWQFVDADADAFDMLGSMGVTRFRFDPAVASFGRRIADSSGDESIRHRWKALRDDIDEFRAAVTPDER